MNSISPVGRTALPAAGAAHEATMLPALPGCLPKPQGPDGTAERGPRNRKPRWRKQHRQELRKSDMDTNEKEIWCVTVMGLKQIPLEFLDAAVKGLPVTSGQIWLRKKAAKRLCALDRAFGGFSLATITEYRRCDICHRPLLGEEATARRELISRDPNGRSTPCGPECGKDKASKLWEIIACL
jgi:hypothetical protein